jgi:hypothetical protein
VQEILKLLKTSKELQDAVQVVNFNLYTSKNKLQLLGNGFHDIGRADN